MCSDEFFLKHALEVSRQTATYTTKDNTQNEIIESERNKTQNKTKHGKKLHHCLSLKHEFEIEKTEPRKVITQMNSC